MGIESDYFKQEDIGQRVVERIQEDPDASIIALDALIKELHPQPATASPDNNPQPDAKPSKRETQPQQENPKPNTGLLEYLRLVLDKGSDKNIDYSDEVLKELDQNEQYVSVFNQLQRARSARIDPQQEKWLTREIRLYYLRSLGSLALQKQHNKLEA